MATFSADIEDYSLVEFGQMEEGLGWNLDLDRCAILFHDFLPYYLKVLPSSLQEELRENNQQLLNFAYSAHIPLMVSAPRPATSLSQRGLGAKLWGMGPSVQDTQTFAIDGLSNPQIPRILKRSLSAYFATDLDIELRRQGKDQLIISGVFTAGGILASTFDALARDVEVFVVADATGDFSRHRHASALHQIATTTGEVISLQSLHKSR